MRSPHSTAPLLLLLSACGGPPAVKTGGPAPASVAVGSAPAARPALGPPVDVWTNVLKGGSTYTLKGGEAGPLTVAATDARPLGGGAVVRLRWTLGGADFIQAPSQVAADASSIHLLDASLEDADVQDALQAPSPWPRLSTPVPSQTRLDGLYADVWRGPAEVVVCYGEGPPPDAPPCEDVCFAELCVSDRAGIVELGGTWAPNFETYTAAGYEKFREAMTFEATAPNTP